MGFVVLEWACKTRSTVSSGMQNPPAVTRPTGMRTESRIQPENEVHVSCRTSDCDISQEYDIGAIAPTTADCTVSTERSCTSEHMTDSAIKKVQQCLVRELDSTTRPVVGAERSHMPRITDSSNEKGSGEGFSHLNYTESREQIEIGSVEGGSRTYKCGIGQIVRLSFERPSPSEMFGVRDYTTYLETTEDRSRGQYHTFRIMPHPYSTSGHNGGRRHRCVVQRRRSAA